MAFIITFFIIGVILICLEMVLPGGITGIIGGLCLIVSVGYTFYLKGPEAGFLAMITVLVGSVVVFFGWLKFLPKDLVHQDNAKDWHGTDLSQSELLGKEGITQTVLRPSGFAIIDEERIDVVTEGEMIQKGMPIKVVMVEGNRIVVSSVEQS